MTPPDADALVSFARVSNSPPPLRELLAVRSDGSLDGWRSNGPIVGRFDGRVGAMPPLQAAIGEVEAGDAAPPGELELAPGAAWEEVTAGGRTARFAADDAVEGPWAALVEQCRRLLDGLDQSPAAAIAIVVRPDGKVRLEHRGSGTLALELGSLAVALTLWRDGREAARGAATASAGRVEAGPGWSLDVPDATVDLSGGGRLVAVATFIAEDAGVYVPMAATGIVDA